MDTGAGALMDGFDDDQAAALRRSRPIGVWTGPRDLMEGPIVLETALDVMAVLVFGAKRRCQDIIFQTGYPVMMNVLGRLYAITDFVLERVQFMRIARLISGEEAIESKLAGAGSFNKATSAADRNDRDEFGEPRSYRYRVNISACRFGVEGGGQIVCRYIPSVPPTVEEIGLEPEIVEESTPEMGSVILAGATGSGKTTTFGALLRRVMETETTILGNVITLEEPVEFVFDTIQSAHCIVAQAEVPRDFPTFEAGIEEYMRKTPRLIVIGEQRSYLTIEAGQEAANTGQAVYTTIHANSVAMTLHRIAMKFPPAQREQAFEMAVATTHMIVSQVLVPKVGGGRLCLREWLVLDDDLRDELTDGGLLGSRHRIRTAMRDPNRNTRRMIASVVATLARGDIDRATAERILRRYGYSREERASLPAAPIAGPLS